jgi:hypothetical protein
MSKEWGRNQEGSKSFLLQETHCHENELRSQRSQYTSQQTTALMD